MIHDFGLPLDLQWTDIVIFGIVIGVLVIVIWKLKQRKNKKDEEDYL